MLSTSLMQFDFTVFNQDESAAAKKHSKHMKLVAGNWHAEQATDIVYHHDMWMDFTDYVAGYGVLGAMFPSSSRKAHMVCQKIRNSTPNWEDDLADLTCCEVTQAAGSTLQYM